MSLEHSPSRLAYTINQLCEASGLGRTFIYTEIGAGRLEAVKAGNRTLIPVPSAESWLDSLPKFESATQPTS